MLTLEKLLLGLIMGLAPLILGAVLFAAWEHRPDGWPNWVVTTPIPFVHFHLGFGDGPFGKLADLNAKLAAANARSARIITVERVVTVNAAAAETKAQTRIQTVTKEIVREVPTYITAAADARCIVPVGFVRLHDAAAGNMPIVSDPAAKSDDTPSGLELSAVAQTIIANYGAANANAEQLTALQAWIRNETSAGGVP